ncbi:neuronal acetylcholine receptor subunit beta-4-like [Littorina saxatilis]
MVDWKDPDLWWDPSAVGSPGDGVDHLQLTSNDIWTPKLVLLNRAEDEQMISQYDTISVRSAGHCSAELPIRLETTCQVDVANYPFDTQVCQVIFGALYQDRLSLSAQVLDAPLHQLFSVSGEWEIQNITVNPRDISFYKFVEFRLTLKRRPTFYLFTVIFPIVLLSVTGACGFLLPLECGEKVSFQVAIMVSLAVFLSFINDSMPKTSSSISRLAIYVDLLLLQSCLSFLATLTVLRGHHLRERLRNKDRERKHDSAIEPADQEIARDKSATSTNEHGWQRVKALGKRLLQCVRRTVRRMYCCCCCIPPGMLDTFFFVVFMTSSLSSPALFFMPNMPWESQILNVQLM